MKNKVVVTLLTAVAVLTGCSSAAISGTVIDDAQESVSSEASASVSEESESSEEANTEFPKAVLGIAPTKAFEEVYMPIAEIVDSYEEERCLHFLNEVEDILDSKGYEYTYETDAYDEYDVWIIVKDTEADAEIRIYGHYDEFDNVNVSDEDIRYDLACVEYQAGQYYGITDLPTLNDEPCKHGVDDNHAIPEAYEYFNIGREEHAIINVDSTEDVRSFFFVTE